MTKSEKELQFHVSADAAAQRLDKFLGRQTSILSRTRAAELIDRGLVSVNKKTAKSSLILKVGDLIQVNLPRNEGDKDPELTPLALPLDIFYQDDEVAVINKPAGLVVHPAAGHAQDTLVNALIHQIPNLAMGFGEHRPGIVHRLDKGTSGLMVVAKTDRAQEILSEQFRSRKIHRLYWAVAHGQLKQAKGTLVSYLRRHPIDRKKFASEQVGRGQEPLGKRAVTHFERLQTSPWGFSLVHCRLETGRTHQIRVHLSELGHPLVGDRLYRAPQRFTGLKNEELQLILSQLDRVALHAAELGFRHPLSEKELRFQAPWPQDLLRLVEILKFKTPGRQ